MRPFSAWAKIIGHRGSAGTAPENTLLSFREARDAGAQAVMFDVMLAKDGVPVVFHDSTLDRTTNGHGNVWDHTVEELKQLDAGSWFLPQCAGEQVPTFEEAVKLCASLGLRIRISVRPRPGQENQTIEAVLEILEQFWPIDQSLPLIASFSTDSLARALMLKPEWPRGLIFDQLPNDWRERVEKSQSTILHGNAKYPSLLLELVAIAKPVYAYTVNDVKRARSLFALGIAGILTDYPGQMLPFAPGQRAAEPEDERKPLHNFRPKQLSQSQSTGTADWSPIDGADLIGNAEHAVRVAQNILAFYLGEDAVDVHAPYHADLHNDIWTVTGRTNGLSSHRVPEISFSKKDGQVYRILADR